jgi:outer membrane protein assembly factor BamA
MNRIGAFTLLAAALTACPALADTTHTLDKINIRGLKSADPAAIAAQLKDQPGAKVTKDDILGDQDQLEKVLEAQHITGAIKTSLLTKGNGHVEIIFDVDDQGVAKPVTTMVAPKLKTQVFVGNAKISSDDLLAASGLTPGEDLSTDKIVAAQAAIGAVYKKRDIGVSIQESNAQSPDGTVQITWTITEVKAKKKKKNTEDEGGFQTDTN